MFVIHLIHLILIEFSRLKLFIERQYHIANMKRAPKPIFNNFISFTRAKEKSRDKKKEKQRKSFFHDRAKGPRCILTDTDKES